MALHTGPAYRDGNGSLRAPDLAALSALPIARDVSHAARHGLAAPQAREDAYYFAIYLDGEPVGQMVLHDLQPGRGETLLAYHLFQPAWRGQGIGTRALRLAQQHLRQATRLRRAVIITARDNVASRRLAEKCGFTLRGASREEPETGLVYAWDIAAGGC